MRDGKPSLRRFFRDARTLATSVSAIFRRADGVWRGRWRGARALRHDQRGAVTLETALALVVVVSTFASMAAIIGNVYESDRIGRAARAAARAVSFDPGADACAAAHREIGQTRPTATEDRPCGGWDVVVSIGVAPGSLASVLEGGVAVSGSDEMVLVQISSASGEGFGVSRSE